MVPASDDSLDELAFLLGAPPPTEPDVAAFLSAWLADPRGGYEPDPLAAPENEQLRRGLAALAPRQRAAAVLRCWSGLPAAEVAELLDCPEETVDLETDAALDMLATDEERLAAGLAALAADAPRADAEPAPPRRWRSAGVAAGVLVAAGVFASVLGVGTPASAPPPTGPPSALSTFPLESLTPSFVTPVLEDPAPDFDNRSRRLTAQIAAARKLLLPSGVYVGPASVTSPLSGSVLWAPLVFHVADTPDLYLAVAMLGSGHDATVLKIDVGYRDPKADPRFVPCPEYQLDCLARRFADGTVAGVSVFTEPVADQTIHRLTAMRPDGTFVHVSVFYRERRSDPPPLGVAELFRFATVFTY